MLAAVDHPAPLRPHADYRQMRVETRRIFYAANPCVLTLDQPGRFRAKAMLACFAHLRRWLLDLDVKSFGKTPLRLLVRVATAFDGASAQQAELYVSVLTGLQRMAGRYNLDVTFQFRVKAAGKVARVCLPFGDRIKCRAEIDEAVDIVGTSAELVRMFESGRAACPRLLVSLERCEGILSVMGRRVEAIREGKEAVGGGGKTAGVESGPENLCAAAKGRAGRRRGIVAVAVTSHSGSGPHRQTGWGYGLVIVPDDST